MIQDLSLALYEPTAAEKTVEAIWGKCPLIVVTENKTTRATLKKMDGDFVDRRARLVRTKSDTTHTTITFEQVIAEFPALPSVPTALWNLRTCSGEISYDSAVVLEPVANARPSITTMDPGPVQEIEPAPIQMVRQFGSVFVAESIWGLGSVYKAIQALGSC